jgi:hypothetical protein
MNLIELREEQIADLDEKSRRTYQNSMAKVLEAVVGVLPESVVLAIVREWGAEGRSYPTTIRRLRELAERRREQGFPRQLK